jgi:hypothetical protein
LLILKALQNYEIKTNINPASSTNRGCSARFCPGNEGACSLSGRGNSASG